jgi:hypothetical protein
MKRAPLGKPSFRAATPHPQPFSPLRGEKRADARRAVERSMGSIPPRSQSGSSAGHRRSPHRHVVRGRSDRCQHLIKAVSHRFDWEARDPIARCAQDRRSLGVLLLLLRMDTAIELDGQAAFGTGEIEHERPDRMLAAKRQAMQPSAPQRLPQHFTSSAVVSRVRNARAAGTL